MIEALAALLVGCTVASASLLIVHPTRPLAPRINPYVQRARLRLGQTVDRTLLFTRPQQQSVLSPLVAAAGGQLSRLVDADPGIVARRVRHSGWDMTLDQYRTRQLATTVQGAAIFVVLALVLVPSAPGLLAGAVLGAIWGASRWRTRVEKTILARREQERAELATIGQLLAMDVSIGTAPAVAIERLAHTTSGVVAGDLTDAVNRIREGTHPHAAFEQIATDTAEPAAARFYRQLATADTGDSGTLIRSLLASANELRVQQREELQRLATRRRFTMLIPTIVLMGPVMLLFLAAPLPYLIFGD